jgi:hypothetical protein
MAVKVLKFKVRLSIPETMRKWQLLSTQMNRILRPPSWLQFTARDVLVKYSELKEQLEDFEMDDLKEEPKEKFLPGMEKFESKFWHREGAKTATAALQ